MVGGEAFQSAAHDLAAHEVRAGQDVGGTCQFALVCQAGRICGGGCGRRQIEVKLKYVLGEAVGAMDAHWQCLVDRHVDGPYGIEPLSVPFPWWRASRHSLAHSVLLAGVVEASCGLPEWSRHQITS